jgi:hypothetical protein
MINNDSGILFQPCYHLRDGVLKVVETAIFENDRKVMV